MTSRHYSVFSGTLLIRVEESEIFLTTAVPSVITPLNSDHNIDPQCFSHTSLSSLIMADTTLFLPLISAFCAYKGEEVYGELVFFSLPRVPISPMFRQ